MPDYTAPRRADPAATRVASIGSDDDSRLSGVSWGAVIAGAVGASALALILLILGFGLGLSAVSPWSASGASSTAIGVSTIIWLGFTQIIASGLGGYLAGRLRVKWAAVHGDEVYFRDTAHGFLAWALAALVSATVLTSAIASAVSGGAKLGAEAVQGAAAPAMAAAAQNATSQIDPVGYLVDGMLRASGTAAQNTSPASSRAEVGAIIANSLRQGALSPNDRQYLATLVAQRSGASQAEAERRVDAAYAQIVKTARDTETAAREAADKARKAAAYTALWTFIALLAGAFVASLCALWGGRQRDAMTTSV